MPTTREKKSNARKSREGDMLSDIGNLDIMLGSKHLKREENELSNSVRRPQRPRYITLVNYDANSHSNSRKKTR